MHTHSDAYLKGKIIPKCRLTIVCFVAGLMLGMPALAQEPAPKPSTVATAATDKAIATPEQGYLLGAEDVLQVEALGRSDFSAKSKIAPDGTIQLPLIGTVAAANLTTLQLGGVIKRRLQEGGYFANPIVQVEVASYASRYVTVLGSVKTPGLIPMDRPYRLSEIIARVGGIDESGADFVTVRSGKGDDKDYPIKEIATGNEIEDPYVQPGAKIFSPKAAIFYIKGQIKAPGAYAVTPGMTLIMALARGGGITDLGSESHVHITRTNKEFDPPDLNVKIQPDDVIDVGQGWF